MSKEPVFLSYDQVSLIHERMISEYGGAEGLRDSGLLESAVSMPLAQYEGAFLHKDIASMTGAYLFHLCSNHPFIDGNKRTALASALLFAMANGYRIEASDDELEELTCRTANSEKNKDEVITFFRKKLRKIRTGK